MATVAPSTCSALFIYIQVWILISRNDRKPTSEQTDESLFGLTVHCVR